VFVSRPSAKKAARRDSDCLSFAFFLLLFPSDHFGFFILFLFYYYYFDLFLLLFVCVWRCCFQFDSIRQTEKRHTQTVKKVRHITSDRRRESPEREKPEVSLDRGPKKLWLSPHIKKFPFFIFI
jgi:hypothetical protein